MPEANVPAVAERIASRVADIALLRQASLVRVSCAAATYGAATFSGKARTVSGERPDADLADDLRMLVGEVPEGEPVRVETPRHGGVQAVRFERVADEVVATLLPRTLFDMPIRGLRAA